MDQENFRRPEHTPSHASVQGLSKRAIIMAIVLFGLVVAGMFTFTFMKKAEYDQEPVAEVEEPQQEVKYASISRVDAKHFFEDGVHTLVGEIPMPTPCDLLQADAIVAESFPEQVTIDFSVINNAEFCAQVITAQRFKVSAIASEAAIFSARLEGREIELNLIPAAPGESPEDFELFIKG